MEEDWATGTVTAMKSGTSMHIILPASMVKYLGVIDRDILKLKAIKTGETRERRYAGVKNLKKSKPRPQESSEAPVVPNSDL